MTARRAFAGVALLCLILFALMVTDQADPPSHLCQRVDGGDTRLAARTRDGLEYQDHNGFRQTIGPDDSALWVCHDLDLQAEPVAP